MLLVAGLAGCFSPEDPSAVSDGPERPTDLPEPESSVPEPEPDVPAWPHHPNTGISFLEDVRVASFGGHEIPVSIYKPEAASADVQFPVILQSHGFTGSRASSPDAFLEYIKAGFGVVSFDQRGHGDARATSTVGFMQPDIEVLDAMAVIDEIATWDWVLMEAPGDPLLGTIGYSYGGAFQLMTAVFDDRIDAMVPEITWHNITTALAPNGAIKSGWVDLFYVAGNAQGSVTFNNDFHKGFAWAGVSNEMPAAQAPEVPDLVGEFNDASPENYPAPAIPTLLVQGMPDTLFPLNHAVWNYEAIKATGAPVQLYTHNAGHVLNTESLAPGQSPIPVGLQGAPGQRPCGEQVKLDIMWHQKHLLGLDVDTGSKVCIALQDNSRVQGSDFPLPGVDMVTYELGGPWPIVQAAGGTTVPFTLIEADAEVVLAGIPRLRGNITSPGADSIVYWSLQIVRTNPDYAGDNLGVLEHIVNDQVRPLRTKGPNTGAVPFDMELGGIGVRLQAGDELRLVASSLEPMYFGNSERLPAAVVLEDLILELPTR